MAVEVRTVDRNVTDRASLILRSLVMEIRGPRGRAESRGRVALQAENIEIARLDQVRIRRSMG